MRDISWCLVPILFPFLFPNVRERCMYVCCLKEPLCVSLKALTAAAVWQSVSVTVCVWDVHTHYTTRHSTYTRAHTRTHTHTLPAEEREPNMQTHPPLKAITPDWNQIKFEALSNASECVSMTDMTGEGGECCGCKGGGDDGENDRCGSPR